MSGPAGGDLGSGTVADSPLLRMSRSGGSKGWAGSRPTSAATAAGQPWTGAWASEAAGEGFVGWSRPSSGISTVVGVGLLSFSGSASLDLQRCGEHEWVQIVLGGAQAHPSSSMMDAAGRHRGVLQGLWQWCTMLW